jgi:hypothetical protein
MRRTNAILTILALGLPLIFTAWTPPAGAITLPPPVLPHNGSLVIDNFTGMNITGLRIDGAGAVRLGQFGRFWGAPVQAWDYQDTYVETAIGGGANDTFVMVYTVNGPPGQFPQNDIMCQLLNNRGEMLGGPRPVCTDTSSQNAPVVAMAPDGSFLVAWMDRRGGDYAVYAQRFDASGGKLGAEFCLTSAPGPKHTPAIAPTPSGGYVVAWTDTRTGKYQIFVNVLDRNGTSVSGEKQVTLGADDAFYASVALDSQGRILVAFCQYPSGKPQDIGAQRLDPRGERLGGQMSITGGSGDHTSACVCAAPDDTFLVVWTDSRNVATTGWDIYGQRFDAAGSKVGVEINLCDDAGDQTLPQPACDPDGGRFVAFKDSDGSNASVRAVYISPLGIGRPITMPVSVNPKERCEAPGIAVSGRGDFMAIFNGVDTTGSTEQRHGLARAYLSPHLLSGTVATGNMAVPEALHRWDSLSAEVSLASQTANTVAFEYSTDGGLNWTALPANNSLAGAGAGRLAVRARLSTIDNLTTPVLNGITLRYKYNHPPAVKLPADMTVKKGSAVTIVSNVTDADLFDVFTIAYRWTQTAGKNLTLTNATGQNLSFKADKAGTYTFRLVANDGWNDSAPATITVKVTEPKPAAKSGFEWALVLGAASVIAVLVRKKRLSA